MEIKKETDKKNDGAVFELTPSGNREKKEIGSFIKKTFPFGFLLGVFATLLASVVLFSLYLAPIIKNWSVENPITIEQAKTKAENFINDNLMQAGSKIAIKGVEEKSGLYKVIVNTGSTENVDTYISKDGKIFFPQVMDIEKIESDKKTAQAAPTSAPVPLVKNDKPEVELFVMSHCPYGTQIEKGILPVVAALGNKINFDVKFTDYAMHGEKELQEEIAQYCIKTNEPAKFNAYLKCFVESASGDSAGCQAKAKINAAKLKTCVADTDKKFKITENFANKDTWKGNYPPFDIYKESNTKYAVQGSPTLVINGATLSSGRDSASLLKTICSAFNTPPKECESVLSSTAPAPGFGTGAAASANSASCGS